jgi:RNA polymerase sigma-70 factor (ECF subfamily)
MTGMAVGNLALNEWELDLVTRCLEGDAAAWEAMVSSYGGRIRRMAFRYLSRREEAEDLAQEVFIRVYRNLSTFRADTGSLQNWLVRVGRNLIIDHFRQARRLQKYCDGHDLEMLRVSDEHAISPDRSVEQGEVTATIRKLLEGLPDDIRQAVVLRYLEGLSYQEIADRLSIPEGTVKSRINRGRARMARLLCKHHRPGAFCFPRPAVRRPAVMRRPPAPIMAARRVA